MKVLEWVVLLECECVRLGVSAAVCDVLCSVVVTAVSVYYYIRVGLRPPDVLQHVRVAERLRPSLTTAAAPESHCIVGTVRPRHAHERDR